MHKISYSILQQQVKFLILDYVFLMHLHVDKDLILDKRKKKFIGKNLFYLNLHHFLQFLLLIMFDYEYKQMHIQYVYKEMDQYIQVEI